MFDSVFHGSPTSAGGQSISSGRASLGIDAGSGTLYFRTPENGGWQVCASGSGTPGGTSTDLQYNNGGAFGGSSNFTFNPTTEEVFLDNTISGAGTGAAMAIGTVLGPPLNSGGLMLTGEQNITAATLEIHNNFSSGINVYSHVTASFRAPLIQVYQSRGTQGSPTASLSGDSLGYYEVGGYTGSGYTQGLIIQTIADANWSSSSTPAHTDIYTGVPGTSGTSVKSLTINGDGSGGATIWRTLTLEGTGSSAALVIANSSSPTSAGTAGITGQIAWDSTNLYVCTTGGAAGAATWKKLVLQAD
jgi:hypothetical protein